MRILVVDDEPFTAMNVAAEIARAGHEVLGPVSDKGKAIELARTSQPDLVVLDIQLGQGHGGAELAMELNALGLPMIISSAHSAEARKYEKLALGFLAKPYNPVDMPAIIAAAAMLLRGERPAPGAVPRTLELFSGA